MSPGFLFSSDLRLVLTQGNKTSQSSMSPGFLFREWDANQYILRPRSRNPVWVLAFFSVRKQLHWSKVDKLVAIQYESWLSFQLLYWWKPPMSFLTSQSSMSPGFLFSLHPRIPHNAASHSRNPVWVLAFFSVNRLEKILGGIQFVSQSSMSPRSLFSQKRLPRW